MMKFGWFFALCLFAVWGAPALAGDPSYTTNTQVELSGTFRLGTGPDANDKQEYYYYLELDHPIYVVDHEYNENESDVRKIQLAISTVIQTRTYKGKRIRVKGSLFHSFTAHHHTKILMDVNKEGGLQLLAPPKTGH